MYIFSFAVMQSILANNDYIKPSIGNISQAEYKVTIKGEHFIKVDVYEPLDGLNLLHVL